MKTMQDFKNEVTIQKNKELKRSLQSLTNRPLGQMLINYQKAIEQQVKTEY